MMRGNAAHGTGDEREVALWVMNGRLGIREVWPEHVPVDRTERQQTCFELLRGGFRVIPTICAGRVRRRDLCLEARAAPRGHTERDWPEDGVAPVPRRPLAAPRTDVAYRHSTVSMKAVAT